MKEPCPHLTNLKPLTNAHPTKSPLIHPPLSILPIASIATIGSIGSIASNPSAKRGR